MTSSNARTQDRHESSRNLDDLDLTTLRGIALRAVVLPESSAAKYSTGLPENRATAYSLPLKKSPPSPSNSCSEDDITDDRADSLQTDPEDDSRTRSRLMTGKSRSTTIRQTRKLDETRRVLVLDQSNDEKFTFGTARGSKVVLKSPDWEDQDSISYSNLLHMELYPDPGRDAIVVYNSSTSGFTVRSLAMPLDDKFKVIPQNQITLDTGTWQLTLGKGWSFQIKILSRPPVVFNGVLISPTELTRAVDRSSKATKSNASSSKTSSKEKYTTPQHISLEYRIRDST